MKSVINVEAGEVWAKDSARVGTRVATAEGKGIRLWENPNCHLILDNNVGLDSMSNWQAFRKVTGER